VGGCPESRREAGSDPTLIRDVLLSRNKNILLPKGDEVQGQMHRLSTARSPPYRRSEPRSAGEIDCEKNVGDCEKKNIAEPARLSGNRSCVMSAES
jgi:hypothetical protein